MIAMEISQRDLNELTKTEVKNLPGALFSGTSPLLKPFMNKLEALLPPENKGRGENYVLCALQSYIDEVHAEESLIWARSKDAVVEIRRDELACLMDQRYPTTGHQRLNLPGLLFLQSGPALQTSSAMILRRKHKLRIPDGRRTLRYIFHLGVVTLDADKEKIKIGFDLERLPKRPDGTSTLE